MYIIHTWIDKGGSIILWFNDNSFFFFLYFGNAKFRASLLFVLTIRNLSIYCGAVLPIH